MYISAQRESVTGGELKLSHVTHKQRRADETKRLMGREDKMSATNWESSCVVLSGQQAVMVRISALHIDLYLCSPRVGTTGSRKAPSSTRCTNCHVST